MKVDKVNGLPLGQSVTDSSWPHAHMVGPIEDFTDKQCRMVVSRPKRFFLGQRWLPTWFWITWICFLIFVTDSTMVNTIIWEIMFWNFFGQNTRNCVIFDVQYDMILFQKEQATFSSAKGSSNLPFAKNTDSKLSTSHLPTTNNTFFGGEMLMLDVPRS